MGSLRRESQDGGLVYRDVAWEAAHKRHRVSRGDITLIIATIIVVLAVTAGIQAGILGGLDTGDVDIMRRYPQAGRADYQSYDKTY